MSDALRELLFDKMLGLAKSTREVFDALDEHYRQQNKPPVWLLPLTEPIAPHLDDSSVADRRDCSVEMTYLDDRCGTRETSSTRLAVAVSDGLRRKRMTIPAEPAAS